MVDATYPYFRNHIGDKLFLQGRAILASTLVEVDEINEYMVSMHDSDEMIYLSADSICLTDRCVSTFKQMHTVKFLNTIKSSGLPNHELKLKVDVPVMLMQNINHVAELCNGTRLVITRFSTYVLDAEVLGGRNAGDLVFIPRMTLDNFY